MKVTPEITTNRLALRPVRMEDAPEIFAYVKNPNVLRYTTGTTPRELAETEAFVRRLVDKPEGAFAWAIRLKTHPEAIGVIEFGVGDGVTGSVDYALSESYWNQGIMTEAVRVILGWAFRTHASLKTVSSAALKANPASTRVQLKCGMKLLRVEQETWNKFDHPVELAVCAISREEWEAADRLAGTDS
jgi:[ribosomal protein S5]-alanine N-acetyltransferase